VPFGGELGGFITFGPSALFSFIPTYLKIYQAPVIFGIFPGGPLRVSPTNEPESAGWEKTARFSFSQSALNRALRIGFEFTGSAGSSAYLGRNPDGVDSSGLLFL